MDLDDVVRANPGTSASYAAWYLANHSAREPAAGSQPDLVRKQVQDQAHARRDVANDVADHAGL